MNSRRLLAVMLGFALAGASIPARSQTATPPPGPIRREADRRFDWWRDARFGLMIHWGLYSLPAGEWKGQRMEYIGEWLMSRFRIPVREYEQLAARFNPVKFDADAWVRMARRAGMRYLVFVSKHHDGFAMFRSSVDRYNIYDATPFRRDVLAELAAACRRHGLRLGVYYSQDLDWHEPDGGGTDPNQTLNHGMSWGNNWDFPNHAEKRFERYFERKSKPQVRELLTKYGPLGILWFDTPRTISPAQADELYQMVRTLQPACLVNSRLGQGRGDYGSLGDNMIPSAPPGGPWKDWEAVATMNDTWGYKEHDTNWKSSGDVLTLLTGLAGKNVNYLLNVGPTALGEFPAASTRVLEELGAWMERNGESIHGTRGSPFAHDLPWGPVTRKPGRLYLHLQKWPAGGTLVLHGLRSRVQAAALLTEPARPLRFTQEREDNPRLDRLRVELPATAPACVAPVLALTITGEAIVDPALLQQADGSVTLPAHAATIHRETGRGHTPPARIIGISRMGGTENWIDPRQWLTWAFTVYRPGRYTVKVLSSGKHRRAWVGGHKVAITVAGASLTATLARDEDIQTVATRYYPQVASRCGSVEIGRPGVYQLALRAESIARGTAGLTVASVQLVPERPR